MGNPKQKWTAEEEEALRAGVAKHGTGKWKNIKNDPEFSSILSNRSNIDLKDKWRNMTVAASGEKSRTPRTKDNPDGPVAYPVPLNVQPPPSSAVVVYEQPTDVVIDDPSKCVVDGKTALKYDSLIYEALATLNDPNGSDTSAIVSFIEMQARQEVPPNIRKSISSRLRRLVGQEKLEKVQNCYRVKRDVLPSKSPTPKPIPRPIETQQPKQPQASSVYHLGDTVEEAAVSAAYKIADAENKSFVAAEAVKEAERISRMTEEAESLLRMTIEILEKCVQGETVMMS